MIIFFLSKINEAYTATYFEIILPEKNLDIGLLLLKWKTELAYSNKNSTFELLKMFFTFYANFDFRMQVICAKTGESKMKDKWMEENKIVKSKVEGY